MNRSKSIPRISLIILPILITVATLVYGFFDTNSSYTTSNMTNFFVNEEWRHGLTFLETLFDPVLFWGELSFNTFIAIMLAAMWLYQTPMHKDSTWKINNSQNKKLFSTSVVIVLSILVGTLVTSFFVSPGISFALTDWWVAQASYQVPAVPLIISIIAIIVAPMKLQKRLSRQGHEIKKEEPENKKKNIQKFSSNQGILLFLMTIAFIPWILSMLSTNWHPRGLFHFNYQFHLTLTIIVYPVSLFIFLATLLLRKPPKAGDGRKSVRWEYAGFALAIIIIVILQVSSIFIMNAGIPRQVFDLNIYWWWPAAHLIEFIYIGALAFAIITGTRYIKNKVRTKKGIKLLKRNKLTKPIKAIAFTCLIAAFVIPPITGYLSHDDDPPRVLVNQVGYLPNSTKAVLFQAPMGQEVPATAPFSVIDETTGEVVHAGTLERNSSKYGHWYMAGEFNSLNDSGTYYVKVDVNGRMHESPMFLIGADVYEIALDRAVDFFYYQRCGYEVNEIVPGYAGHGACHLDDALVYNGTDWIYKNLTGGWHDAGDYNKYNSWYYTQWRVCSALADAWENTNTTYTNFTDQYDSESPDIIDEMLWGARYLIKCVDTEGIMNDTLGLVIHNVVDWDWGGNKSAHMSYWGPPDRNTDNIPNTGDERVVFTSGNPWNVPWGWASAEAGFGFAGAMLRVARLMEAITTETPSWAPTILELRNTASLLNQTYYPIAESSSGTKLNTTSSWPHQWTAMARLLYEQEVALLTGNWSVADDWAFHILNYTHDNFGDSSNVQFMASILRHYIEYNRPVPPELITTMDDWRTALFEDHFIGPLQVFHLLDEQNNPVLFSRGTGSSIHGLINADHFNFMLLLTYMNELNDTYGRLELVQHTLDYLFGVNPLGISMMDGVGGAFVPQIHHRYSNAYYPSGRVPGGIINGIRRYNPSKQWAALQGVSEEEAWTLLPEIAWVDNWPGSGVFSDGVDSHSNEIWIIHNGVFLELLSSFLKYHV